MLGRMFGHEFHALLIFQKFLIADDFAALFGFWPPTWAGSGAGIARVINPIPIPAPRLESLSPHKQTEAPTLVSDSETSLSCLND